jgi:hypothetical protein
MQLDFAPDCLLGETVPIAPNRTSKNRAFMRTPENRIALAPRPSPRRLAALKIKHLARFVHAWI